jgi:hypothetical protein
MVDTPGLQGEDGPTITGSPPPWLLESAGGEEALKGDLPCPDGAAAPLDAVAVEGGPDPIDDHRMVGDGLEPVPQHGPHAAA